MPLYEYLPPISRNQLKRYHEDGPFILSLALSLPIASDATPEAVRDIAGNKLRAGVDYYVLSVILGRGGGLNLASAGNESCPLKVAQDQLEVSQGLPLAFSPVNPRHNIVLVSTDHNVIFSAATICVQSTAWKLDNIDEETGQYFITIGGVEGNPGHETTGNWFKIEKYEQDYKLVFCPTVCSLCKVICRDIGICIMEGNEVSALSDDPWRVVLCSRGPEVYDLSSVIDRMIESIPVV